MRLCATIKCAQPGTRTRLAEKDLSGQDLSLQQDIVRLVDELQNILTALKREYQEEIEKLQQKVREMKASSGADRSTSEKCIEDNNSLKKENDNLKATVDIMAEELAIRERHDADRSEDVERTHREMDQLWAENETPQDLLGEEIRQNGVLKQELEMTRHAIKDNEVNITELQNELKLARAQNEEVQQALKGVLCWIALAIYGVQAGYGILTTRLTILKSEKATLADRIAAFAEENELLKWLLCQSDAEVAKSIHQEAIIEQLEKDAEAVKRESEEGNQIIGRLHHQIANLELLLRTTAFHSDQQVLSCVARQSPAVVQSQPAPDDGSSSLPRGGNPPATNPPGTSPPGTSPPETSPPVASPSGTSSPGTSSPGTSSPGTSVPGTSVPETIRPPVGGQTALYLVRDRGHPRRV